MEEYIKLAFKNVQDPVRRHVFEGHYDLVAGPLGEVTNILPQAWKDIIEPGWDVYMLMWPMIDYQNDIGKPAKSKASKRSARRS